MQTGKRVRPPIVIETMLRMYLLQCWFNLSDEGVEDAISCLSKIRTRVPAVNVDIPDLPAALPHIAAQHGPLVKNLGSRAVIWRKRMAVSIG